MRLGRGASAPLEQVHHLRVEGCGTGTRPSPVPKIFAPLLVGFVERHGFLDGVGQVAQVAIFAKRFVEPATKTGCFFSAIHVRNELKTRLARGAVSLAAKRVSVSSTQRTAWGQRLAECGGFGMLVTSTETAKLLAGIALGGVRVAEGRRGGSDLAWDGGSLSRPPYL